MKRYLSAIFLLFTVGCGGGGGSTNAGVNVSNVPAKLQQDLVCYMEETDQNGNTVYVENEAPAKEISFTLSSSDICSSEFSPQNQDLVFEGCTVSVVPVSKLPDEMTSSDFLKEMASEISCNADDITAGGTANAKISITAALVDLMKSEYTKYKSYAPFLYKVNVTYKFSSSCGDGTVEKTVSIPVEFSDFVENDNDLCQQ